MHFLHRSCHPRNHSFFITLRLTLPIGVGRLDATSIDNSLNYNLGYNAQFLLANIIDAYFKATGLHLF